MPVVQLPDGRNVEFPEGMSHDQMAAAIKANGLDKPPSGGFEGSRFGAQALGGTVGGVLGGTAGFAVGGPVGAAVGSFGGEALGAAAGEEAYQAFNQANGAPAQPWSERVNNDVLAAGMAGIGKTAGAAVGAVAKGAVKLLVRGGPESGAAMRGRIADFQAAGGATPTVAQAAQSHPMAMLENTIGATPGGAAVIAKKAEDTIGRFETRTNQIATSLGGGSVSPEDAGIRIKQGITNYSDWYKAKGGQLERQWESELTRQRPNFGVAPNNTLFRLDELSNKYGSFESTQIFEQPTIKRLVETLNNDTAKNQYGELPIGALQTIRTQIGRRLGTFQVTDTADVSRGELRGLYDTLTQDIQDAFVRQNIDPATVQKFAESKAFWKQNIDTMDNFLSGLAKKGIEPEKLFTALETSGKNGATMLRTVRNSVSPDDWSILASGILQRMGQTANTFSVREFLRNYNGYSEEAKAALFSGHPHMAGMKTDLDQLARVAGSMKNSGAVWDNPSGSGRMIGALAGVVGFGSMFTGNTWLLETLAAGYGGSAVVAKAMTNPTFVHWLAQSTKVSPNGIGAQLGKLSGIAANSDPDTQDAIKGLLSGWRDWAVNLANTPQQPPEVPKGP